MTEPIILLDDSDDEDDSPLFRRNNLMVPPTTKFSVTALSTSSSQSRKQPSKPSHDTDKPSSSGVTKTSTSSTSNHAAKKTTAGKATSSKSWLIDYSLEEDSDDDLLEVLPMKSLKSHSVAKTPTPAKKDDVPRLSSSGSKLDPLGLSDDDHYDGKITKTTQNHSQMKHNSKGDFTGVAQQRANSTRLPQKKPRMEPFPSPQQQLVANVSESPCSSNDSISLEEGSIFKSKMPLAAKISVNGSAGQQDLSKGKAPINPRSGVSVAEASSIAETGPATSACSRDADDDSFSSTEDLFNSRARVTSRPPLKKPVSRQDSSSSLSSTEVPVKPKPTGRATGKTTQASREATKAKKKAAEERAEKRKQREREQAAKKQEKALAKERREQERKAKREAGELNKQVKKRAREEAGQARGKFANQEIAVLMDPRLKQHEVLGPSLESEDFKVFGYPSGLSALAVQWIRKDYLEGGADQALEMLYQKKTDAYEHLDVLVIVFDTPHDFIDMIQLEAVDVEEGTTGEAGIQPCDDDDYPKLEEWLMRLIAGWRAAWRKSATERPRIYLLLRNVQKALDRLWVNYNRRKGNNRCREPPPPNAEQLYDAILWLLIQFKVECIHCESEDSISHEIFKLTRFLTESRYAAQTTELACVQKIKAQVSDTAPSYDRAVDCWMRQIQQIPRVSAEMARQFVRHYPTARSLWNAYQDKNLTADQKRVLVADCFGTRTLQVKLAGWIFRVMTGVDPEELIT